MDGTGMRSGSYRIGQTGSARGGHGHKTKPGSGRGSMIGRTKP